MVGRQKAEEGSVIAAIDSLLWMLAMAAVIAIVSHCAKGPGEVIGLGVLFGLPILFAALGWL